jgi:hypothetical protein
MVRTYLRSAPWLSSASISEIERTTEPPMNPFNTTALNYELARDRRRSFEQAASRRRLVRFGSRRTEPAPQMLRRPPDRTLMRAA